MTKEHILSEIRRTAATNGGVLFGVARFFAETGIRESDWHGYLTPVIEIFAVLRHWQAWLAPAFGAAL